jgi:hypothetical protein
LFNVVKGGATEVLPDISSMKAAFAEWLKIAACGIWV